MLLYVLLPSRTPPNGRVMRIGRLETMARPSDKLTSTTPELSLRQAIVVATETHSCRLHEMRSDWTQAGESLGSAAGVERGDGLWIREDFWLWFIFGGIWR